MKRTVATKDGGIHIPLTAEEIQALEAEEVKFHEERRLNKYKEERAEEYGAVQDQLDMMYWDKMNGTDLWVEHISGVKAKHPKP